MKIEGIKIKNYKFIKELQIEQMENVCVLIGRNNPIDFLSGLYYHEKEV